MPIFSVETEEEAIALLTLTCPRNRNNEFVAPELAEEQTLDNLYAFGDRLRDAYARLKEARQSKPEPAKKKATKKKVRKHKR